MEPLTIGLAAMAGAQVVSGIMQYYQAEKARKASSKRLKEIEAMFDRIVPPGYDLKVWDDPKLVATIPEPEFNLDKITPELYESVGQYVPQVADYVAEARPELVKASDEAKKGRDAQMEALERYRDIARGGLDPVLAQKLSEASRRAQMEAQSRQASILQDANRRGQAGSLMTMAAQMQGGSDAMERAALESQLAAAESYRNQLRALDQSAALGGQIRQSEMAEAARNADIINSFNQRTSQRYQQYAQMRADMANQANLRNLDERQRIADANVQLKNAAQQEWVNRQNALKQQQYMNARQTRQDRIDVEKYKNSLLQQMYQNEMDRARGKAGIAGQQIDYLRQDAQDRNQMIQGLGNTVGNVAMTWGQNEAQHQRDARWMQHDEAMRSKYPNTYGY